MAYHNKSQWAGVEDKGKRGGMGGDNPSMRMSEKTRSRWRMGGAFFRYVRRWIVRWMLVQRSIASKLGTKPSSAASSKRLGLQTVTLSICFVFATMYLMSLSSSPTIGGILDVMTAPLAYAAGLFAMETESFRSFRARHVAPVMQKSINVLIVVFAVQSLDTLIMTLISFYLSFTGWRPPVVAPLRQPGASDPENPASDADNAYPLVVIQIPMFNEIECYKISIGACSQLQWPRNKLIIQVLDDSNKEEVQEMVKEEVTKWQKLGVNIDYRHRVDRTGYKGGSLKQGMEAPYVKNCQFVAVFDADFQPRPDWLLRTVPYFKDDPKLALVQTRWEYTNQWTNLLTRFQFINMSYHFEVEQQVMGATMGFFGFNGTAGIWRIAAVTDCGGWDVRTTVEDMDIAVRAHIHGWKFVFLNDVRVPSELPQTLEAYTRQQHRWHAGPMNLFRLLFTQILKCKTLTMWSKFNLIVLFFFVRRLLVPTVNFMLFVVLLPLSLFVPEAEIPLWVTYTFPMFLSFFRMLLCPMLFPYMFPYLFFENTMVMTKLSANIQGLFGFGRVNEWKVTEKVGFGTVAKGGKADGVVKNQNFKKRKPMKIFKGQLFMAVFLFLAAIQSLAIERGIHFYVFLFQAITFFAFGCDLLSEHS